MQSIDKPAGTFSTIMLKEPCFIVGEGIPCADDPTTIEKYVTIENVPIARNPADGVAALQKVAADHPGRYFFLFLVAQGITAVEAPATNQT